MKKILLTLALAAAAAVSASAQLSVGAGYAQNDATSVTDDNSVTSQTAGFYVEGTMNVPVTRNLSIAPSLRYTYLGAQSMDAAALASLATAVVEGTIKEHYVSVPVMARYNVDLGGATAFIFAGPTFDFGLSSELKVDTTTSGSILDAIGLSGSSSKTYDQYGENTNYKETDLYVGGGIGIRFGGFELKGGYHYGMMDRDRSDDTVMHNSRIEAGIAYVF